MTLGVTTRRPFLARVLALLAAPLVPPSPRRAAATPAMTMADFARAIDDNWNARTPEDRPSYSDILRTWRIALESSGPIRFPVDPGEAGRRPMIWWAEEGFALHWSPGQAGTPPGGTRPAEAVPVPGDALELARELGLI